MSYKALYRTYRPQTFEEVIGQDVIVKTLKNAIKNGKTTHAYLFSGPRGTGKTSIARILAKSLNCPDCVDGEPCNKCRSCQEIMEGNSPDVIEIDAASNNGVDEIREIREKVKFLPAGSRYKIYIIDEVHMLTTSAFNALLKTLEEPPKHVIFILATTEPQKVLPTILSRCQRYDFRSLTVNEISKMVRNVAQKENVKIQEEAIVTLAESAEGGMRDALSFLDQAISLSDEEITVDDINNVTGNLSFNKMIALATCFETKNVSASLKIVNELLNMGKEVSKIVSGLLQFYRDVLLFKNLSNSDFSKYIFQKNEFKELAERIEEKKIFYYVDVLSETQSRLRLTTTPHIFLEVSFIKMMNVSSSDLDLIEKINKLQEEIDELSSRNVPGEAVGAVDNKKLVIVDEKINRVVSELGKLDLPKLIQRVQMLEATAQSINQNTNNEYEKDLAKIKEEVYLIKANYSALQNHQYNEKEEIEVNPEFENKLNSLEEEIRKLQNNQEVDSDAINDLINDRIADARREVRLDYDKINNMISERLKEYSTPVDSNVPLGSQIMNEEIRDRFDKIEEKLYKIMSGTLANQTLPSRKSKEKINKGQIVLFGQDMVQLDAIEKRSVKERYNFEDLEKVKKPKDVEREKVEEKKVLPITVVEGVNTTEEPNEPKVPNELKVLNESISKEPVAGEPIIFEKNIVSVQEKPEPQLDKTVLAFGESKYEMNTPAESILNRSVKGLAQKGDKDESKVDVFGYSKYEMNTPAESILNRSVEKLSDDNKPKSQLVIRKRVENNDLSNTTDLFKKEKEALQVLSDENNLIKRNDEIIVRDTPKMNESEELDEFERYDVRVIERILNDSRKEECKNDRGRIINLWKVLTIKAPDERKGVAQILEEGTIVAVGNREFILVYATPSICNQVMRRNFKRDSLKLLFDLLGGTYNYMALPENIWLSKRAEYVNQYSIGTKNIKLQPFNEPVLKALMSETIKSKEEEMFDNAEALFGKNIIEYKE